MARRFGSFAVAVFQPSQHRFADVDSAVVHEVHLFNVVAVGFEQFRHRPAEQVVTYVAEMQRFVGVRRRIFHHYRGFAAFRRLKAILLHFGVIHHKINPIVFIYLEIQETFYHVERSHQRTFLSHSGANLVGHGLGGLAGGFHEGEHHKGEVAGELFLGFLKGYRIFLCVNIIQFFQYV